MSNLNSDIQDYLHLNLAQRDNRNKYLMYMHIKSPNEIGRDLDCGQFNSCCELQWLKLAVMRSSGQE